jgi:hypothetical protein
MTSSQRETAPPGQAGSGRKIFIANRGIEEKTLSSNKPAITLAFSAIMLVLPVPAAKLAADTDANRPATPRGRATAAVATFQITPASTISGGREGSMRAANTMYAQAVSAYDAAGNNLSQRGSMNVATQTDAAPNFPTIGAHALAFYPCMGHTGWLWRTLKTGGISTPSMITEASGSTMLTWVGRGKIEAFTLSTVPTDNKGNAYRRIGSVHDFSPLWPNSGEALYISLSAVGGNTHIVTAPLPGPDEITLATVEIKNGGVIEDAQWNKVILPPQTSLNVTTTGPATLVAVWVGDAGAPSVTASPNNGFTVIDSQLLANCQVEAVVATKVVSAAGTYNVTWTATPTQGAHMWLVAVQNRR